MRKPSAKRPSPALVIALIALFVALGGSAYAATKIGTSDIKSNAITAAKIKNGAVTTAKIKNGAVNGAKVNEASLGTVPAAANASHADSADSATNAANATNAVNATNAQNFSRYFGSGLKRAAEGEQVTLLTIGPFSFVGECVNGGGGSTEAAAYVTTSQGGANLASSGDSYVQNDFEPGTEARVASVSNIVAEVEFRGPGSYFTAQSGDGSTLLEGSFNIAVNAFAADCAFELHGINTA